MREKYPVSTHLRLQPETFRDEGATAAPTYPPEYRQFNTYNPLGQSVSARDNSNAAEDAHLMVM